MSMKWGEGNLHSVCFGPKQKSESTNTEDKGRKKSFWSFSSDEMNIESEKSPIFNQIEYVHVIFEYAIRELNMAFRCS